MRGQVSRFRVGAMAGLLLLAAVAAADEKDKKIKLEDAPKAVRDAIEGRFPGAKVSSIEKETEDGKVVFDVELKHKDRKYEMDIQEDGTILEIEKEIKLKDVPEAVLQAVKDKFPRATIQLVMEVNKVKDKKETPDHYEITVKEGDKEKEITVSLDGKTVKAEKGEKEDK
jgi:uncharacterized membrane protein YkoI